MLPGFRFVFAAIILSMSVLVFGLGAAALLRAAHEEFASTPAWRPTPETMFAKQNEATRPVLALLRVDAPTEQQPVEQQPVGQQPAQQTPAEQKTSDNAQAPEAPPQTVIASTPPEPEPAPASKPEDASPMDATKPDIAVAETAPQIEAAPAQPDPPVPADETRVAAVVSPANEAASIASEQARAPAAPDGNAAATKIAMLGGPAATVEPPAVRAKRDRSAVKKRVRAQRAKKRSRLARRARLVRQQAPQPQAQVQPTMGFGQPAFPVRSR